MAIAIVSAIAIFIFFCHLARHPVDAWDGVHTSSKPESKDKVYGGASLPRRSLYTRTLKIFGLYVLGITDAGKEFHSLAVRIKNDDEKHLVREMGINQKRMVTCSTSGIPMEERRWQYENLEFVRTLPEV